MTFPLGSLRSDGAASSSYVDAGGEFARSGPNASPHHPAGWRVQLGLLVSAVAWLLAVLALTTHSAADSAFSTSGAGLMVHNKAGALGAWFSDLAFFGCGYSVWWAAVVALRAWLGTLARLLRSDHAVPAVAPVHVRPVWVVWVGTALLLAASASLEWTRLYQWEGQVAGGHAGGALGYALGGWTQHLLGFAGSGVLWIAALVCALALALRFSWLQLAQDIGAWVESWRERRVERFERAEDARVGE